MTLTDWIDDAAEEYADGEAPRRGGFKAGALAAVEKLSAMGVSEFDEQDVNTEIDRLFDEGNINHWSEFDWARYMARWQHSQTAALLAARDVEICQRLEKAEALLREAISQECSYNEFVDRCDQYFSEQPKGGDHVE